MRDTATLSFKLGQLESQFEDDWDYVDDEFTLDDTFDDPLVNDNPYLRRLAKKRGQIDALRHLTNTNSSPRFDWQTADSPMQLVRNARQEFTDACTHDPGHGTTWTDYLWGWVTELHWALRLDRPTPGQLPAV